jgi:hypothetical protein
MPLSLATGHRRGTRRVIGTTHRRSLHSGPNAQGGLADLQKRAKMIIKNLVTPIGFAALRRRLLALVTAPSLTIIKL